MNSHEESSHKNMADEEKDKDKDKVPKTKDAPKMDG